VILVQIHLTLAELRFPPQRLHLPKYTAHKENTLHYKIRLPNDESKQWLYKRRIQQKLQEIPEGSNIILECRTIKATLSQAADEILGKYKALTPKNKNTWDDDTKLRHNGKIRKKHRKSWEQFLSFLESDI
jgi:hypothetical protein